MTFHTLNRRGGITAAAGMAICALGLYFDARWLIYLSIIPMFVGVVMGYMALRQMMRETKQ